MKQLTTSFSILFISINCLSQTYKGKVVDQLNKQPVAYVNIGVIGKGIGTVSDMSGEFSITLADSLDANTLMFSLIGFKPQSFIVRDFKKSSQENEKIILFEENIYPLSQIVIRPKVLKTKVIGNRNDSKSLAAGFKSNDLGSELGTIMHIKKVPSFVENVNFNIAKNEINNAKFRINIYSMKNGLPDSTLLKEPIYITTSIKSGTLSLDMKKYNLWVNGDYLVSLEWIEDYGPNKLFFCVGVTDNNSLWRKTSQDKWQKATPIGIGFNSTITYEK